MGGLSLTEEGIGWGWVEWRGRKEKEGEKTGWYGKQIKVSKNIKIIKA